MTAGTPRDGTVVIVPLVERVRPPHPSSPRTRVGRPAGYGVREQCLPFTAAAALGWTVPAPFTWGCCAGADVPDGARSFRSPIGPIAPDDERVFYVEDDAAHGFVRNQFSVRDDVVARAGDAPLPGLSFFERSDQQSLVKVHLPYAWMSPEGVELLFSAPVNRPRPDGLGIVSGVVETWWYHNPVNLVVQLPPDPSAIHVEAGEPLAQVLPLSSQLRGARLEVAEPHQRDARTCLDDIADWRSERAGDRSAYRHLARSEHGRVRDD